MFCTASHSSRGLILESVYQEIRSDPFILKILEQLGNNENPPKGFISEHGHLLYKGGLVIPDSLSYIPKLLHEYHDSAVGGHSKELKTYQRLANHVYHCGCYPIKCGSR